MDSNILENVIIGVSQLSLQKVADLAKRMVNGKRDINCTKG